MAPAIGVTLKQVSNKVVIIIIIIIIIIINTYAFATSS